MKNWDCKLICNGYQRLLVFDEIHKYAHWKNFLKGLFDAYGDRAHILVTGSAKLDVFRKGSDSLLGRYFPYTIHPLSVREMQTDAIPDTLISPPSAIDADSYYALMTFGGFPEPLTKQNSKFTMQWNRARENLLFREDIRDLTSIRDLDLIQILATLLKDAAGQLVNLSNLAKKLQVSVNTVKRWLSTLESFYFCYQIRPWTKNISRSLLKEPKVYLWNWADVNDVGARAENFIASHLLKAIHYWNDSGEGEFGLYFIRTKEGKEVDFIVIKNGKPWFLVEVESSDNGRLTNNLDYFQQKTGAEQAFQVVIDMPYVDRDCFSINKPIIVPAQTFLSQLI
ncbi:MAG: ATP-binding protein [Gammaproteobacteria bacterium]|nr:ATP-binding protein [Gammaproteobacteria bacterium]